MILEILKLNQGISIIDENGSYSYKYLFDQTVRFKASLKNKFKSNDRVIIYSDYSFHSIALLIALSEYAINIIPLVKTTDSEYSDKVLAVDPNYILSFDQKNNLIIDTIEQQSSSEESSYDTITFKGHTGIVLFSSGTTGKPKVMIQDLTELIKSISRPRRQKSLIFILLLMFDHIGGLNTLLNCLISGAPFVVPKNRNPSTIIALIQRHEVNVLPTTPTFLNLMLMDESFSSSHLESLKLITYGTERMSEYLLLKLKKLLPKVKLLQTFGTSETGILKTQSKSSSSLYFKIIDDEKEYKIVDDELYIRSKTSVNGYLNHNNDSFKSEGWYATGDLVDEDNEGYIKIIGRKNKLINVGGLKVFPKEIEDVLNSVEGVDDSTVFGESNNLIGNIVCAKVYSNLEDTKALKAKLKLHCRKTLDKYKMPVRIYFEKLSMSNRGKKC